MYHGLAIEPLNRLIDNEAGESVYYYFRIGRIFFSRAIFCGLLFYLIALAVVFRRKTKEIVGRFFRAEANPLNLAIFRIVFFATLLAWEELPDVLWYSQLPKELRFPLGGLGWLFRYLPFDAASVSAAIFLLKVVCVTGILGFFSRLSAFLAAVLGFYVLGIPQCFGKVVHYAHLVWFPLFLAATPCGDALSCDALFRCWKRADRGVTEAPAASRAYGVPLQFIFLLLGILFFFPGFWKWWASGIDWALGDNLKLQMYSKWFELGGWTPFFRLDRYPFLYRSAALATIFFEISFIFVVFLPKVRPWLVLVGPLFHNLTNAFMRIPFWYLQPLYLVFIDWQKLFHRLGHRLFREEMVLIYDGTCKLCRRTIASVRVFDFLGRVSYLNALDHRSLAAHGLQGLDRELLLTQMHAVIGQKRHLGFDAYRAWAFRVPLFWPMLPFLYLWPIPAIGEGLYRRVAGSRTCQLHEAPLPAPSVAPSGRSASATIVVGVLLVVATFVYGARQQTHAWPITCYPTFSGLQHPTHQLLLASVVTPKGEELLDLNELGSKFRTSRWWGMVLRILKEKDPARKQERLKGLWALWVRENPRLAQVKTVRFYEATTGTSPEEWGRSLERQLLFEWHRNSSGTIGERGRLR